MFFEKRFDQTAICSWRNQRILLEIFLYYGSVRTEILKKVVIGWHDLQDRTDWGSNCEYVSEILFTQEPMGGKNKFELMNLIGFVEDITGCMRLLVIIALDFKQLVIRS